MTNFLLANAGSTSSIIWLVVLIVMVVVMLVLPSVTQKKRVKAYQEMQSRLRAGDKVQTIGGIVGRIVRVKDSNGIKTVFIESGEKNNKMVLEFDINAIAGVVEGLNNPVAQETQTKEAEEKVEEVNVDWEPETVEAETEEKTTEKKEPKKNSSKSKKN